ncbi:MAG: glycosyltransferase [Pseudomonadota bacterium]
MDKMVTISVIIPTFNRADLVLRAVRSVLAQRDVRTEIIVVDDGSTDNTIEALEALSVATNARLQIVKQSNAGASAARNHGLKLATGDFIQFLDSDDTLNPNKLAIQYDALASNPEASVSFCHGWLQQSGRETQIGLNLGREPAAYIESLCGPEVHIVQTQSPLWRRDVLESIRWNENISLGDDVEFTIRCLLNVKHVVFIEEALFTVHEHGGDRLSDFSTNDIRLNSLMVTQSTIYEALRDRAAWNEKCAAQMRQVIRSVYAVALQRVSASELREFEMNARSVLGRDWKTSALMVLSATRLIGGRYAARLVVKTARTAQKSLSKLVSTGSWRRWLTRRAFKMGLIRTGEPSSAEALQTVLRFKPEKPTALYVEGNSHHAELIPGYFSLLSDAGYDIVVVTRIGIDAHDALSRMPNSAVAGAFELNLHDMKRFLRSDALLKYEFTFFGSATLVEPDFFVFESILDFTGRRPKARRGNILVEHAAETMLMRTDKLPAEQHFALREMKVGTHLLPMLAPVGFGKIQPADHTHTVVFLVVGRLDANVRDVEGLYSAVRDLMKDNGPPFVVNLVGGTQSVEIPMDIRECFNVLGYLGFADLYRTIERSHFLLPLLNSKTEAHRAYLKFKTTGTRQLSLGFSVPMVADFEFAVANEFDGTNAITYEPGDLSDGMARARQLGSDDLKSLQAALKLKKQKVHADSLENLRTALAL